MGRYWPERRFWEQFSKNDAEGAKQKERLDYNREIFKGHLLQTGGFRELIRYYVAFGEEQVAIWPVEFRPLTRLHRRAAALLVKYGVEYRPYVWSDSPEIEPDIGSCYVNAFRYMSAINHVLRSASSDVRLTYVEGVAMSQSVGLHAWNSLNVSPGVAVDSSWYAMTGWYFYFGIPLAEAEYRNARKIAHADGRCNLLREDVFPRVEEYLLKVLSSRPRQDRNKEAA